MFRIYCYENEINGHVYVGQTDRTLSIRGGNELSNYCGCQRFYSAIQKYGASNFVGWVFEIVDTQEQADESEKFWIAEMRRFLGRDCVYNIAEGGAGVMSNRPVSPETRLKISSASKKIKRQTTVFSDDTLLVLSSKSKNNRRLLDDQTKMRIINLFDGGEFTKKQLASQFGITYETVRFVIAYHKKNGFKTLEEKSNNMSNAKKGKKLSPTHRENISSGLSGIIFSETRKKNISAALTGKSMPQSVRDKIAASLSGIDNYNEIRNDVISMFKFGEYKQSEISRILKVEYSTVKSIIRRFKESINVK